MHTSYIIVLFMYGPFQFSIIVIYLWFIPILCSQDPETADLIRKLDVKKNIAVKGTYMHVHCKYQHNTWMHCARIKYLIDSAAPVAMCVSVSVLGFYESLTNW